MGIKIGRKGMNYNSKKQGNLNTWMPQRCVEAQNKDPGLPFYFHVLNLFKSWSNLGFDEDSNGRKNT
jgi:hypothetical protein